VEDIRRGIISLCAPREVKTNNDINYRNDLGVSTSMSSLSSSTQSTGNNNGTYTLVIYQRNLNRKFKDLSTLTMTLLNSITQASHALYSKLNVNNSTNNSPSISIPWRIHVLHHHDEMHPCMLHEVLSHADILLTSHGFQNTGIHTTF